MDYVVLLGRVLLGGFFLYSGFNHFRGLSMMSGYAASKGIPYPKLAIGGTGALLLIGGLSIVLGYQPVIGVVALVLFFVGVTPMMHAFWKVSDPQAKMAERVNFAKNAALLGAVLMLLAIPQPWALSLGGLF
jgi:putative oxidoreductase